VDGCDSTAGLRFLPPEIPPDRYNRTRFFSFACKHLQLLTSPANTVIVKPWKTVLRLSLQADFPKSQASFYRGRARCFITHIAVLGSVEVAT
jgi:hypothetical protein